MRPLLMALLFPLAVVLLGSCGPAAPFPLELALAPGEAYRCTIKTSQIVTTRRGSQASQPELDQETDLQYRFVVREVNEQRLVLDARIERVRTRVVLPDAEMVYDSGSEGGEETFLAVLRFLLDRPFRVSFSRSRRVRIAGLMDDLRGMAGGPLGGGELAAEGRAFLETFFGSLLEGGLVHLYSYMPDEPWRRPRRRWTTERLLDPTNGARGTMRWAVTNREEDRIGLRVRGKVEPPEQSAPEIDLAYGGEIDGTVFLDPQTHWVRSVRTEMSAAGKITEGEEEEDFSVRSLVFIETTPLAD
jgi:hypothetical protein